MVNALIALAAALAVPAVWLVDAYIRSRRLDRMARKVREERQHAA